VDITTSPNCVYSWFVDLYTLLPTYKNAHLPLYLMEERRHRLQVTPTERGSPNWLHKDDLQIVIILMEWEMPEKFKNHNSF
jgi:hypothetical protein